jgi:hypothetical protein
MLLELFSTRWISSLLDATWLRPAVLVFAAASGLAVVILGLTKAAPCAWRPVGQPFYYRTGES